MYGSINMRGGAAVALQNAGKLTADLKVKSLYSISYPIDGADSLIQVEAIPEFMPHLISWSTVAVPREGKLSLLWISRRISKYLENMADDERTMVAEQIYSLFLLHEINDIDLFDEGFFLHCTINGVARSAVVTVFNMIQPDSLYAEDMCRRDSIN